MASIEPGPAATDIIPDRVTMSDLAVYYFAMSVDVATPGQLAKAMMADLETTKGLLAKLCRHGLVDTAPLRYHPLTPETRALLRAGATRWQKDLLAQDGPPICLFGRVVAEVRLFSGVSRDVCVPIDGAKYGRLEERLEAGHRLSQSHWDGYEKRAIARSQGKKGTKP